MIVITRTKTEAEGSVKYECPERNDSLGKETKQPNLQKEERSDKSLRVVVVTKRGWVVNQINQTYFLKGLRMKKSVCLMAILGALGTTTAIAAQQSVEINFDGEVINQSCTIKLLDGTDTLYLGTLPAATANGERGSAVPMFFKLSGCTDTLKKVTGVALENDLLATPDNAGVANINDFEISTSNPQVIVKLYKTKAAKPADKGLADVGKIDINKQGDTVVPAGYAALVMKHDGKGTPVQAGTLKASAMFSVTYE